MGGKEGRPLWLAVAIWQGEGSTAVCQQGFILVPLFSFSFSLQPLFFLCCLSFNLRRRAAGPATPTLFI